MNFFYFNANRSLLISLLSNKFSKAYIFNITFCQNFRYSWCAVNDESEYSEYVKYFQSNLKGSDFSLVEFLYFNEFNINNFLKDDSIQDTVENIVEFKLNSGFLKKDFNISHVCLEKLDKMKFNDPIEDEDENNLLHTLQNFNNDAVDIYFKDITSVSPIEWHDEPKEHKSEIDPIFHDFKYEEILEKPFLVHDLNIEDDLEDIRTHFFKVRLKNTLNNNRKILAFFLKKKIKKNKNFNKFIKNFIKKPLYDFILFFEFSLKNILLRSQFFFNSNDVNFFIKNNLISVNGKIVRNNFFKVNIFDKISVIFDKYYFFYYRNVITNTYINLLKLNNFHHLSNQKQYDFNKQQKKHSPKWAANLIYFREDIPNFLEVDFVLMSFIILYKPEFFELDLNKVKFLNYFQRHLYNWKFII